MLHSTSMSSASLDETVRFQNWFWLLTRYFLLDCSASVLFASNIYFPIFQGVLLWLTTDRWTCILNNDMCIFRGVLITRQSVWLLMDRCRFDARAVALYWPVPTGFKSVHNSSAVMIHIRRRNVTEHFVSGMSIHLTNYSTQLSFSW